MWGDIYFLEMSKADFFFFHGKGVGDGLKQASLMHHCLLEVFS